MLKIVRTPSAKTDLIQIWKYIAQDSPDEANSFLEQLYDAFYTLSEFPLIGVSKDYLQKGLRMKPFQKYNIYYSFSKTELILIRVLHGSIDIQSKF